MCEDYDAIISDVAGSEHQFHAGGLADRTTQRAENNCYTHHAICIALLVFAFVVNVVNRILCLSVSMCESVTLDPSK